MGNYIKIRPGIKTGDILLCDGAGWISWLIKLISGGPVSHIAMCIVSGAGQVQVLESTTLNKFSRKSGVQLNPMGKWVKHYRGKVFIRHLKVERPARMITGLNVFVNHIRGTSYEKSLWQLFCAAWDGWFGENKPDLSSIFCSELVAAVYQLWNLLPPEAAANEFTPADFMLGGKAGRLMRLSPVEACMGKEIRIK